MPEARSLEAEALLQSAGSIAISTLTRAEFLIALTRLRKLGTLSQYQHDLLAVTLEGLIQDRMLELVPVQSHHFAQAALLARRGPLILRTLDALHLAVAASLGCPLATFDARLAAAAKVNDILLSEV